MKTCIHVGEQLSWYLTFLAPQTSPCATSPACAPSIRPGTRTLVSNQIQTLHYKHTHAHSRRQRRRVTRPFRPLKIATLALLRCVVLCCVISHFLNEYPLPGVGMVLCDELTPCTGLRFEDVHFQVRVCVREFELWHVGEKDWAMIRVKPS